MFGVNIRLYFGWFLNKIPSCDHMAHLGGAITGILLGFIYLLFFETQNQTILLFHKIYNSITDIYLIACILILLARLIFNL